jgi:hypothetical protein
MNITEFATEGLLYITQMQRKPENLMKLRSGLVDSLLHTKSKYCISINSLRDCCIKNIKIFFCHRGSFVTSMCDGES